MFTNIASNRQVVRSSSDEYRINFQPCSLVGLAAQCVDGYFDTSICREAYKAKLHDLPEPIH